jgi:hypothetical protein
MLKLMMLALFVVACNDTASRGKGTPNPQREAADGTTPSAVRSHLFRVAGTEQMTAQAETQNATNLPAGYLDTPELDKTDDGLEDQSVIHARRPVVPCGLDSALATIAQRIRDCANKNPNQSEWLGLKNATGGEGTWRLVALKDNEQEIWLDETTGFIWSHVVSTTSNWCQAAGNTEKALKEGGIDCSELHDDNTRCEGKDLLGIPASQIAWRLPNRADFLQADLNGARFVLPRSSVVVWTATVNSEDRENAWSITPKTGALSAQPRSASLGVRCLGRRLK